MTRSENIVECATMPDDQVAQALRFALDEARLVHWSSEAVYVTMVLDRINILSARATLAAITDPHQE
jgi:hypothetical protein